MMNFLIHKLSYIRLRSIKQTPHFIKTRFIQKGTASIIIISILLLTLLTYIFSVRFAVEHHRNNMIMAEHYFVDCKQNVTPQIAHRMIVLRLDDVQADSWSVINERIIEDALKHRMPIVAGVIPKNISKDFRIESLLWRERCNIEIALHGYTHTPTVDSSLYAEGTNPEDSAKVGEFGLLTADEARVMLTDGFNEVSALSGYHIETFIPPQNQISPEAQSVLIEFGITHLSSEGKGMYDYDSKTWGGTRADHAIAECEMTFDSGDPLCVIMLHPQDFSTSDMQIDTVRYAEYLKLLDTIKEMDVSVVRFSDLSYELIEEQNVSKE